MLAFWQAQTCTSSPWQHWKETSWIIRVRHWETCTGIYRTLCSCPCHSNVWMDAQHQGLQCDDASCYHQMLPRQDFGKSTSKHVKTQMASTSVCQNSNSTLWCQHLPKIAIMKIESDLCDVCQQNNHLIMQSAIMKETKKCGRLKNKSCTWLIKTCAESSPTTKINAQLQRVKMLLELWL